MARKTPVHSGYTIINGSGTGSNGIRIDVWVEYRLGTQSVTGNYTPITAYFYAALNASYSSSTSNVRGLNSGFRVNGDAGTGVANGSYDFTSASVVNFLGSYSGNIPHNTDGTKTVTISGSFTTISSYISGGSVSASVKLPTIPRASTVKATPTNIGETSIVAVHQNSAGYTHSVAYQFGSLKGYITANGGVSASEVKYRNTSIPFTIPESFYAVIPGAPSGTCTLTCRTYSGSAQIGDPQTCTFTVTAPLSKCKPDVDGRVEDVNEATLALTGDQRTLVRYMSTALCTITAAAKNSASIAGRKIGGAAVSEHTRTIEKIEADSILFEATDSRGYSGSFALPLDMVPYVRLTNNATVKRTDPTSGNAVLTLKGKCFKGSFGAEENTLAIRYRVNAEEEVTLTPEIRDDNSYSITVPLGGLDYTRVHTVTVTVTDALDQVAKTLTVHKGIPVFDWGEEDFAFHVPVTGSFRGTINGVYTGTKRLSGTKTLQFRCGVTDSSGTLRQSVLLFGNDNGALICGVLGISATAVSWAGTGEVTASVAAGTVTVTLPAKAYDWFTLISPDHIELL